jgi:hypothetical protein
MAGIAHSAAPINPTASLWPRLEQRLKGNGLFTQRRDSLTWEPGSVDGVQEALVFTEPDSGLVTSLVRMSAGAAIPPHWHSRSEQCVVLEGKVEWGGEVYVPGDFVSGFGGSVLPRISAPVDNLLLIIGSPDGRPVAIAPER